LLPTGSYFYLCSTPTIDEEPLSFGAVFTFEPPLEESRSKIYLFS
jgi:hypothetical protein